MTERLVKLKKLRVYSCEVMKDIVVTNKLGAEGRILFPQLESLWLSNLLTLKQFCVGDCIGFKSLSKLTIRYCLELKTFVSCSTPKQVSTATEEVNHLALLT